MQFDYTKTLKTIGNLLEQYQTILKHDADRTASEKDVDEVKALVYSVDDNTPVECGDIVEDLADDYFTVNYIKNTAVTVGDLKNLLSKISDPVATQFLFYGQSGIREVTYTDLVEKLENLKQRIDEFLKNEPRN